MARVTVTLDSDEKVALLALAQDQRRDPRAQAALLIRQGLERSGLLCDDKHPSEAPGGGFAKPDQGATP